MELNALSFGGALINGMYLFENGIETTIRKLIERTDVAEIIRRLGGNLNLQNSISLSKLKSMRKRLIWIKNKKEPSERQS